MKYIIILFCLWAGSVFAQDRKPESPLIIHTKSSEESAVNSINKTTSTAVEQPKTPTEQKALAEKSPLIIHTKSNEESAINPTKNNKNVVSQPSVPYSRDAPTVLMKHTQSDEENTINPKKKQ
jgi:cytoskeletal protein RodZ